ncbi:MAG: hypothetical protein WBZ11_02795 [Candidatus Sulfotelmatobacter sp.]|jgi:uncharacterized membrane protein
MAIYCPECETAVPDLVGFCPSCGFEIRSLERVDGNVGVVPVRLGGALAYLLIPSAVFLSLEPYKSNRFVRFHSLQSIGFLLAGLLIGATLWLVGSVLGLIPVLALLFVFMLVGLALFVVWIVLIVKALQGEMLKLPLVGQLADR